MSQVEGRTVATQRDVSVSLLGAMGDAFLNPTGDLHVAFSWDLARVVVPDSRAPDRPRQWVGVGVGAAVGYDIRVARSFYLGASVHLLGIAAIVPSKVELTTSFALTVDALYF